MDLFVFLVYFFKEVTIKLTIRNANDYKENNHFLPLKGVS